MSVDLRRFRYALEPLRQRRRWELDALRAELGRVQQRIVAAEAHLARLEGELREATVLASRWGGGPLDPPLHAQRMAWLVQLREGIAAGIEVLEALRAERERVRARLVRQQQKVEVLERHRSESIADFTQQEQARLSTEADRDWLARSDWTANGQRAGGDE